MFRAESAICFHTHAWAKRGFYRAGVEYQNGARIPDIAHLRVAAAVRVQWL